ncbi:MAG: ribosome-associated translation inhibitor RaiA [Myxococcales bacterium]|nr:ribosome-associated translation inhibitor RaiA [Myxococcales bacterium]
MRISVTFRHMEPTEAIKEYAERKLAKVKRYLDEPIEANIVLSIEKHRNIAEMTLTAGRSSINCTEETDDIYSSIDNALTKLERQIKKQKDKTRSKKGRSKPEHDAFVQKVEDIDEEAAHQPEWMKRIAVTEGAMPKPIGVQEAVVWMDANPASELLVFTEVDSKRINVLYRRKSGDFGLIQTQGE